MHYSDTFIIDIHHKYAASDLVFNLVYTHCEIVWKIAKNLVQKNGISVDMELIRIGALLHDIGVYPLLDASATLRSGKTYISHGIEGEAILKAEGLPESICHIASHHTGVGLSKHDIISQNIPLPIRDYYAESEEEALIMYADKFHSKTLPPTFNSYDWYERHVARFGKDKVSTLQQLAARFGMPNLDDISTKYSQPIR
jgi:uncharacterized protein